MKRDYSKPEADWLTKAKRQAKIDLYIWTPILLLDLVATTIIFYRMATVG